MQPSLGPFLAVLLNLLAFYSSLLPTFHVGLLCFLFASVKPSLSALTSRLVSLAQSSRPVPFALASGISLRGSCQIQELASRRGQGDAEA